MRPLTVSKTRRRLERGARSLPLITPLAALACGQLLRTDDYRVASPGTFEFANGACGDCMKPGCSDALGACAKDEDCRAWEACMARCSAGQGRGECEYRCFVGVPGDAPRRTYLAMADVSQCSQERCYDACEEMGVYPGEGPGCADILRDPARGCVTQARDCSTDATCLSMGHCLMENNCVVPGRRNPRCFWDCADATREYATTNASQTMGVCAWTVAHDECGFSDRSCVDNYSWPFANPLTGTVTLFASDGPVEEFPQNPLSGRSFTACSSGTCLGGTGTTDASGLATIAEAPLSGGYFRGPSGFAAGPRTVIVDPGRTLSANSLVPVAIPAELGDVAVVSTLFQGGWDASKARLVVWVRSCGEGPFDHTAPLEITLDVPSDTRSIDEQITGMAYFNGVTPGPVKITAKYDGVTIAEHNVWTEADAVTIARFIFPISK